MRSHHSQNSSSRFSLVLKPSALAASVAPFFVALALITGCPGTNGVDDAGTEAEPGVGPGSDAGAGPEGEPEGEPDGAPEGEPSTPAPDAEPDPAPVPQPDTPAPEPTTPPPPDARFGEACDPFAQNCEEPFVCGLASGVCEETCETPGPCNGGADCCPISTYDCVAGLLVNFCTPPADGGVVVPPTDGGDVVDAGAIDDGGQTPIDGGAEDAGVVAEDAGAGSNDAGSVQDAGQPDAG